MQTIDIHALASLQAGRSEYSLFDVRESGEAHRGHIFGASFLPRRRIEPRIRDLVGRLDTPVVVYDAGGDDDRATRAAQTLDRLGYRAVRLLAGGLAAWAGSGRLVSTGSNVPSKLFGELVEHYDQVPHLSADQLAAWQAQGRSHRVCDIRSPEEYARSRIPSARGAFGTDLALLAADLRASGEPVVVHCSGRTRSIIACQSLRALGVTEAYALEDGTMGWVLSGRTLERGGADGAEVAGEVLVPSAASAAAGETAARSLGASVGVTTVTAQQLRAWLTQRQAGGLNCVAVDVRQLPAYEAGHVAGAIALPGGLAIQRADEFMPVRHGRVVLIDDGEARAWLAGYWLRRMGFSQVHVLAGGVAAWAEAGEAFARGRERALPADLDGLAERGRLLDPAALQAALATRRVVFVDVYPRFLQARPAGAEWIAFGDLERVLASWPAADREALVLACADGALAPTAAANLVRAGIADPAVLAGGLRAWLRAGLPVERGPRADGADPADIVTQPYDAGPQAMARYLAWERDLVPRYANAEHLPWSADMNEATSAVTEPARVAERMGLIRAMLTRVRAIAEPGVDRAGLERIKTELLQLASRDDLFPAAEFPPIPGGMYRLSEDPDHRYALYIVSPDPGGFAPPHDHTTWAVIAGMRGREANCFYRRTDDGSRPGVATIEETSTIDVVAGVAIAMMPDDIHSFTLGGDGPHGNLHLYGMSVEHCPARRMFSRSKDSYKIFPAATGVIKAAGAD